MTAALVSDAPTALALSLTAVMAYSRANPWPWPTNLPAWLPWTFLILLGVGSCWLAIGHPEALYEPGLEIL